MNKAEEYLRKKLEIEEGKNVGFLVGMLIGTFTGMVVMTVLYRIYNF